MLGCADCTEHNRNVRLTEQRMVRHAGRVTQATRDSSPHALGNTLGRSEVSPLVSREKQVQGPGTTVGSSTSHIRTSLKSTCIFHTTAGHPGGGGAVFPTFVGHKIIACLAISAFRFDEIILISLHLFVSDLRESTSPFKQEWHQVRRERRGHGQTWLGVASRDSLNMDSSRLPDSQSTRTPRAADMACSFLNICLPFFQMHRSLML